MPGAKRQIRTNAGVTPVYASSRREKGDDDNAYNAATTRPHHYAPVRMVRLYFFSGVFFRSRVNGACPLTTGLTTTMMS